MRRPLLTSLRRLPRNPGQVRNQGLKTPTRKIPYPGGLAAVHRARVAMKSVIFRIRKPCVADGGAGYMG